MLLLNLDRVWSIRRATPADAVAVARVHIRSWQVGYAGLLPDEMLSGLRAEDRAARYTFGLTGPDDPATFIAVDSDGAIRGFVTTGPSPGNDPPHVGQLWALYVDPDAWGMGVGKSLIDWARGQLQARGYTEAMLWVLVGNERAERFYRNDGWAFDGLTRSEVIWGVGVDEKRYRTAL